MIRWQEMPEGREKYAAYLAGREWGLLKHAVHARAGGKCERCRLNPIDAVHHLTYIRKYAERLEDLQGICQPCHEFTHGRSNIDPLANAPVMVLGREIRTVYLAGKITRPCWRPVVMRFDGENDSYPHHESDLPSFRLNDKRVLTCTGPFTIENWNGHAPPSGRHGADIPVGEHYECLKTDPDIVHDHQEAIASADLFFAWIDSEDCFGTLVEIGYASACQPHFAVDNSPLVFVAGPCVFPELWFSYRFANRTWFGDKKPIAALNSMILENKGSFFDVHSLSQTGDDPDEYDEPEELSQPSIIPGLTALHPYYGVGRVVAIDGIGFEQTVRVNFFAFPGERTFVLSRSPLTIIPESRDAARSE